MNTASSETASAGPQRSGARRRLSRATVLGIIAAIAVVLAVVDQVTKNWAEANLEELVPQPFLGEVLQLTLLYNTGAAWGMGSEITPVVTCLQLAIAVGVVIFAIRAVRSPWYAIALGLVLGGALGNVHDRLLRDPSPFHGAVVDFLELPNWPVFNIADMAVVGGAILIVLLGLLGVGADPADDDPAPDAPAAEGSADDAPAAEDSVADVPVSEPPAPGADEPETGPDRGPRITPEEPR